MTALEFLKKETETSFKDKYFIEEEFDPRYEDYDDTIYFYTDPEEEQLRMKIGIKGRNHVYMNEFDAADDENINDWWEEFEEWEEGDYRETREERLATMFESSRASDKRTKKVTKEAPRQEEPCATEEVPRRKPPVIPPRPRTSKAFKVPESSQTVVDDDKHDTTPVETVQEEQVTESEQYEKEHPFQTRTSPRQSVSRTPSESTQAEHPDGLMDPTAPSERLEEPTSTSPHQLTRKQKRAQKKSREKSKDSKTGIRQDETSRQSSTPSLHSVGGESTVQSPPPLSNLEFAIPLSDDTRRQWHRTGSIKVNLMKPSSASASNTRSRKSRASQSPASPTRN